LAFHLSASRDFFEEIAKYRAARRIWYKLMKDKYEAQDPKSFQFRFHIQTAGSSLTQQQPMVNIIRTAYQALEAVLGGCQSMHTNSYDEALCLPSEPAVLVALRTQQVIQDEIRVTNTIDPMAGSYYVEWLTDELEDRIWKYMDKIAGRQVRAQWYDPRQGTWAEIGQYANTWVREFAPPSHGEQDDWVLVLDSMGS
jgi:methylmalonyl-CoA mutase N-terminal domain/subunit